MASIPAEAPAATAKIEIDLKPLRVIKQELETLPAKTILIVSGGTGAGKSHACCEAAIAQAKAGNDVVYLCVTIKEARRRISKLKGLLDNEGLPNDWLTLITSRSSNRAEDCQDSDDASPIKSALDYSKILVTTTGYFGRKGHYAYGYQNFHKMIEGRIVICDEVQELWQKMQVFLPLQARYLLLGSNGDGGLYQRMVKCPKTGKKGDCRKCILATLRTPPQGQTSERHFYHQFAQGDLPTHIKQPDLGFSAWEPLHKMYTYQLIDGTLMSKPISKDAPSYHLTENLRETAYDEFLRHLLHYLHNPHLRIEYPVVVKTQERFDNDALLSLFGEGREQKQQLQHVRFPVMACSIPTICGIDLLGQVPLRGQKRYWRDRMPRTSVLVVRHLGRGLGGIDCVSWQFDRQAGSPIRSCQKCPEENLDVIPNISVPAIRIYADCESRRRNVEARSKVERITIWFGMGYRSV